MRRIHYIYVSSLSEQRSNIIRLPCLQCKCDFALFKCAYAYMNFAGTTCLLFFNAINGRLTQRASKSHLYSFEPDDERMRRNRKSKTPRARAPAEIRLSVSTFQPQEHYEAIFRQRAGNPQSNYFHTLMSIQHWTLRPRPSACCA
jgi:hypothetical protein